MSTPFSGPVALIAPAAAVADDLLDATLTQLKALGIDYHLGRHARARHRYLAGTVEQRLADLHMAFSLPDISAVWCLRGGYGCAQLLPGIDWARLKGARARPLIGYSDLSLLLAAFAQHALPAVHGPVATTLGQPPSAGQLERQASTESLWRLLQNHSQSLPVKHLEGPVSVVRGRLVGGNLTALASGCGTAAAMRLPEQAILILEDVGEPYYRLERCFWQLWHSFGERHPVAVCLGSFTDCPRRGVQQSIEEILGEYLRPFGIPLYAGLPSGHGDSNFAWPYGHPATLHGARLSW
jgi:muramoyltetrapeptide carboxypeptidase